MKIMLTVFLVICMLPITAFAEFDLSTMTNEELHDLIASANDELRSRNNNGGDYSNKGIDFESFCEAFDTMCDFFEEKWDISEPITKEDGDFFIAVCDDVRLVSHASGQRLLKLSVKANKSNNSRAIHRFFAMISTIEGELYELSYISNKHKHDAFELANPITDEIISDTLTDVTFSGTEGYTLKAAKGKQYTYFWEYLDNDTWLSVSFTQLPAEFH